MKRRMHVGWILALGLLAFPLGGACSSGATDVPDSGTPETSTSSSSSSSSSSGSSSGSSSSSSSSGGMEAGGPTIIFPFDDLTMATDPAAWPGDTFCINQTSLPGSSEAGSSEAGSSGDDGGGEGGSLDAALEAAPAPEAAPPANTCPQATEVFLQGISTVTYDGTVGDPMPGGDQGSLKLEIPFYGYNQQADFQHIFSPPLSALAGKTLFIRYRLDSGFVSNVSSPGGIILAVKSGTSYTYASSMYTNVGAADPPGVWHELDMNVNTPSFVDTTNLPYDPTNIVAIEIHIDTGSGPMSTVDGGAPPSAAVFHIDTLGFF